LVVSLTALSRSCPLDANCWRRGRSWSLGRSLVDGSWSKSLLAARVADFRAVPAGCVMCWLTGRWSQTRRSWRHIAEDLCAAGDGGDGRLRSAGRVLAAGL